MAGEVSRSPEDDRQEIFRQAEEAARARVAAATEAPPGAEIGPPGLNDPYSEPAMRAAYEARKAHEAATEGGAYRARAEAAPKLNPTPEEPPPRPEMPPPPAGGMSQPAPPPPETKAQRRASPSTRDPDLDLSGQLGGASGGGGVVIPAGMRPDKMETTAKLGKPYPEAAKRAQAAASGLELEAAGQERDYQVASYKAARDRAIAAQAASDDAAAQHAKIQRERDNAVRDRLAHIEALNKEATGKPGDIWNERAAFAGMLGALATGIGVASKSFGGIVAGMTTGKLMDSFINADIQSKLHAREAAGAAAKRETDLLHLHLDRFKDQDRAVEATKLAYWDDILQQAQIYKAENGPAVSDIAYKRLVGDILKHRAETENTITKQEYADKTESFVQKWHAAQVLGNMHPVQPGIRQGERVLTIPASDKTGEHETHVAVPHEVYAELSKITGATNALVKLDREALEKRKQLRELMTNKKGVVDNASRRATLMKELGELQRKRIQTEQKADAEGVTREADFEHAMKMGVSYTDGVLGNDVPAMAETDKTIQASMNRLNGIAAAKVQGASGWEVHPAVVEEPAHEGKGAQIVKRPGWSYTGKLYRAGALPPEGDEQGVE